MKPTATAVCTKQAKRSAIEQEGNWNLRSIDQALVQTLQCSALRAKVRATAACQVGQLQFPAATAPLTLFATLAPLDRSFIYLTFPLFQFFFSPTAFGVFSFPTNITLTSLH